MFRFGYGEVLARFDRGFSDPTFGVQIETKTNTKTEAGEPALPLRRSLAPLHVSFRFHFNLRLTNIKVMVFISLKLSIHCQA